MLLDYNILAVGHCTHIERITIQDGEFKTKKYPALCFLIKHPKFGNILFDTGYSSHFLNEIKKWPMSIYPKVTPVTIEANNSLLSQLNEKGIQANDISFIILSHFHADHIAGLKDFPKAKIICSEVGYCAVKNKKGFSALLNGFIPNLLPNNFESKAIFLEKQKNITLDKSIAPFKYGIDIFNDKSIIAVPLPGHAKGQYGLLFKNPKDEQVFLIADSCWSSRAFKEHIPPSRVTYLIHDNKKQYQDTLSKLHQLYSNNKKITMIPSHCQEIWEKI